MNDEEIEIEIAHELLGDGCVSRSLVVPRQLAALP